MECAKLTMMNQNEIYVVVFDKVWEFLRIEFTIEAYYSKVDAQARFEHHISEAREYINSMTIPDEEDEWIEEAASDKWELYLSGSWSEYHITVMIKQISIYD